MPRTLNVEIDERGAVACKKCQKKRKIIVFPRITKVDDLYYAQCSKCTDNDPYEFLAVSEKKALQRWNNYNTIGGDDEL